VSIITIAVMVEHERLVSNPQVFLTPHKSPDMCQTPGPNPDNVANMHWQYILRVGAIVYFRKKITSDSIIVLRSSTVDLFNGGRTNINLLNASGQFILHIAFRRDENVIVFNTYRGNVWEAEERISFEGHFTSEDGHIQLSPSITICDQDDRFQVMINYRTIHYFKKRFLDNAAAISYNCDIAGSSHKLFSDNLDVDVYPSLANLLQATRDNST
jgi:Galactoside-binding lectin